MSIVLIARAEEELWKYTELRTRLIRRFPSLEVLVACGERREDRMPPQDQENGVFYIYRGLPAYIEGFADKPLQAVLDVQAEQAHIVNSGSYRSDRRALLGTWPEKDLVLEQAYTIVRMKAFLEQHRPDMLFMTDGATISRSATLALCEHLGITYYRMYPGGYLNMTPGKRYFFCSNNLRVVSKDPIDDFDHPPEVVSDYVTRFIDSIRDDIHKVDKLAFTIGDAKRSVTWPELKKTAVNLLLCHRLSNRQHLLQTLRLRRNQVLNSRLSTDPRKLPSPYYIFPLNWPDDAQVLLRAHHYKDALSACELVANVLPYGHTLVIKEHPAWPGMLDHGRLKAFLRSYSNVVYLAGPIRLRPLLANMTCLVTLNSTAAVEALLMNKPVVCLAAAFYRHTGLTFDVDHLLELEKALNAALYYDRPAQKTYELLHSVLYHYLMQTLPVPGEVATQENFLDILEYGIATKIERFGLA